MNTIKKQLEGRRSFVPVELIAKLATDDKAFEQASDEIREWLLGFDIQPTKLERQDVGDLVSVYCTYVIAEQYFPRNQVKNIIKGIVVLFSQAYSAYPERFKASWNELSNLMLEAKDTYDDIQEWIKAIDFEKLSRAAIFRWNLLTYHFLSEGPYRRCLVIIECLLKLTKKASIEFAQIRNKDLRVTVNRIKNSEVGEKLTEVYFDELRNAYAHLTINRLTDRINIQIRDENISLTESDLADRVIKLFKTVEMIDVAFKLFLFANADELLFSELDKISKERFIQLFQKELIVNALTLQTSNVSKEKGETHIHLHVVSLGSVNTEQIRSIILPRKNRLCFYVDKATGEIADSFIFHFFDNNKNSIDLMTFKSRRLKQNSEKGKSD